MTLPSPLAALNVIGSAIQAALNDGPRPSTKHQLERALEALALLPPAQGWEAMLAALKEVAHHADDEAGFMVLVRAAIEKAEGAAPPLPVDRETPKHEEESATRSSPSTQTDAGNLASTTWVAPVSSPNEKDRS